MNEAANWFRIRELGSGGQSTVHLVRHPFKSEELRDAKRIIATGITDVDGVDRYVIALKSLIRTDSPSELGALKVFDKVRAMGATPIERITREIEILQEKRLGLPTLLDSNAKELWMITEYFPKGTLEDNHSLFAGNARAALSAFRGLVATIAQLHGGGIVHRDIKPANVFVTEGDQLIPGDFGIAHRDEEGSRLTATHERVGPRDYMPPWADTGVRLEEVNPSYDVYMLGKLLWCMISGKSKLPREYHRRPQYDLSHQFPEDRSMSAINKILDKCLTEHESDCFRSADTLRLMIDSISSTLDRGISISDRGEFEYPCLICGTGSYKEEAPGTRLDVSLLTSQNMHEGDVSFRLFTCDVCTHRAFFSPSYPDRAASNFWMKW